MDKKYIINYVIGPPVQQLALNTTLFKIKNSLRIRESFSLF